MSRKYAKLLCIKCRDCYAVRRSGGINSMKSKSSWVLLLLLLSGIVLGGFIGEMTARVPGLSWLNFGESFGLNDPLVLNLGILVITFGLSIRITMASIIGVIVAILIYRFL